MSGDYVAANFGGMADAEQQFLAVYNSLTSALQELQSQLERTLSMWTGSAQAAYHQAKQEWDRAAAHMATVLNQLGATIGAANETYQQTERQLTGLWG